MEELLNNPVYHALQSGDASLGTGTDTVRYFDELVSPFAGFDDQYKGGFDELFQLLPVGRRILYATTKQIEEPRGWQLTATINGLQFVFDSDSNLPAYEIEPVPLTTSYVNEMVQLAALTKPGPFNLRTIEFGNYFGIFQNDKLVAMTGQRLHVGDYSEISAVCTHPDHLGKGYAASLLIHQLRLICKEGQRPFLHVRADNERAIALYERLGFVIRTGMNFYFLKRRAAF